LKVLSHVKRAGMETARYFGLSGALLIAWGMSVRLYKLFKRMKNLVCIVLISFFLRGDAAETVALLVRDGVFVTMQPYEMEASGKPQLIGGSDRTKVVMQLDWIFNAQFAGVFQAASSGFFEDAGLDVEIRAKVHNQQTVAAVLEGPIIFGSAESNVLLLELEQGADLRAVATMFQDSPMSWMFKSEQAIQSPADMMGKRVGVHPGDDHPVRYIMSANGFDPESIEIKVVDYDLSSLLAGEIDVKQGYVIDEFVELNFLTDGKAGNIMGRDHGYLAYSQVVFTTAEVANSHPKEVSAFLQALQRGWQKALEYPEATVDLIIEKWNPALDREHQLESLRLIAELVSPNGAEPLSPMSVERWEKSQKLFIDAGILSKTVPLDAFLSSMWIP
jgi:ABC-type nitrate/sulfonate/bicarbonate transport system substrate-binding protein